MGIVYEARDPNLERRVAIKTVKVENLSEEAAAEYEHRFRTEARSAARLQHPNIVSVYDSDRDGDTAFLVMEYIQGEDLKHHLDAGMRYSLDHSLKMIRDLLSALDYAHKQGIVHRDIKPANMLIEPGGRVKLADFGVARIQDSGEATRTQGSMVGTLKYMSPEQVQGQKIDARADLFSVGVVLYQLLTDKRPFDGDNDFSIIHQIIGHTPSAPSSFNAKLPAAIDAVVARALAKDRNQRFATARDFASALQSAIRRAEDSTIVPPADPHKKPVQDALPFGGGHSVPGLGTMETSPSATTVAQELELVYWKEIKESAEPQELEGFLARFPAGIYGDLARRRLRRLAAGGVAGQALLDGAAAPPAVEGDLEATRSRPEPTRPPLPQADAVTAPLASTAAPTASTVSVAQPVVAPARTPGLPSARRKLSAAALAGIAALLVAAVAAGLLMKGSGDNNRTAGAYVATGPTGTAEPPQGPVASGAAVLAQVSAQAPASASSGASSIKARSAGSRPKAVALPVRAQGAASQPVVSRTDPVVAGERHPPATAASMRQEARAAAQAAAASANHELDPVEACKDRFLLGKQLCLNEQCARPGLHDHPVCVRRRAEAALRGDTNLSK